MGYYVSWSSGRARLEKFEAKKDYWIVQATVAVRLRPALYPVTVK